MLDITSWTSTGQSSSKSKDFNENQMLAVTKQLGGVFPSLFSSGASATPSGTGRPLTGTRSGAVTFESLYSEKLKELATKSNGTASAINVPSSNVTGGPSSNNSGTSFVSPTSRGSSRSSGQQISPGTEMCKEKQRVEAEAKFGKLIL